jgi:hypothetical protein
VFVSVFTVEPDIPAAVKGFEPEITSADNFLITSAFIPNDPEMSVGV